MVAAFSGQQQSLAQVTAAVVTDDQLSAIQDQLSDGTVTQPVPLAAIEAMLAEQVRLKITGPADTSNLDLTGAAFPMAPDSTLTAPAYGSFPGYQYSFGSYNAISSTGIAALQQYFDQLAVQAGDASQPRAQRADDPITLSVAGFVFADYFLFIAREMVKSARDALRDYKYPVQAGQQPQQLVDWVNQTGQITSDQFSLADLFLANPGAPLAVGTTVTISGASATIAATDTFTTIAADARYGGGFTAGALVTLNATNDTLLSPGGTVSFGGSSTVIDTSDTLTAVAGRLGTTVTALAGDATFLSQAGLLLPFGRLTLPDYPVSTASDGSSTLQLIASAAGVSVASLATPANGAVAGLFAADSGALLDLPHLPQFPLGDLLGEAQQTGALSRLAGALSRFQLQGLRLPTGQITPNALGMWVTDNGGTLSLPDTAGLYALTGQQLPIPVLASDPFSITVANPTATAWLEFANGQSGTEFTVTPGDDNATAIGAMQSWITTNRLGTGATGAGAGAALSTCPAAFSFGAASQWLAPALPSLPFGAPIAGATSARILAVAVRPDQPAGSQHPFGVAGLRRRDEDL